jgi:Fe-S cluster assembly ATPase SufC
VAAVRELELATEAERTLASAAAGGPALATSPRSRLALVFGGGLALAAVAALVAGAPLIGLALGMTAAGLVAWALRLARQASGAGGSLTDGLAAARERRVAATRTLAGALRAHGVEPGTDPLAAAAAYEAACRERAEAASVAAAGPALRRELDAARETERMASERAQIRVEAASALRAAAVAAGIHPPLDASLDEVAAELDAWRAERVAQAEAAQRSIREYEELTGLLAGGTVTELVTEADRLEAAVITMEVAATDGEASAAPIDEAAAAAEVERHREAAAALAGALQVREGDLVNVAVAEEAAAAARLRVERVVELAGIIDETMALLEAAQRQVHRDLAPVLAAAIREWLPILSGGAYVEAGVNPADLSIEVKERATGAWRQARLLSGGTREQVYLLLRVAMAQHLVTTAEPAPMLLDEITAQADVDRREAILEMLLTMAAERQLILFTHDEAVLAWAERRLTGEPHRVIRLTRQQAVTSEPLAIPVGSAP